MKLRKRFFALFSSLGLLLSGCSFYLDLGFVKIGNLPTEEKEKEEPKEDDPQIRDVYRLYVASGGTMTYEQWLETIKGEPGTSFLIGQGAPSQTQGNIGDTYLDTSTWTLYGKETTGWVTYAIIPTGSSSQEENPQGLAFFLQDDGTYGVGIGTACMLKTIFVPSTYHGATVSKIVEWGFSHDSCNFNPAYETLILPSTIESIGSYAISSEYLQSLEIPSGVKELKEGAICYCKNLVSLTFNGTRSQFSKISFDDYWLRNVHFDILKIGFTDGEIKLLDYFSDKKVYLDYELIESGSHITFSGYYYEEWMYNVYIHLICTEFGTLEMRVDLPQVTFGSSGIFELLAIEPDSFDGFPRTFLVVIGEGSTSVTFSVGNISETIYCTVEFLD